MIDQGLLRPAMLWLVLAALALGVLALIGDARRRRALAIFAGRGARHVTRSLSRARLRTALLLVALALVALAAAGPYADVRERELRHRGVDIAIAVDSSQSMAVRDVATGDRLALAREAVSTIGARLTGSRIALALFANEGVVRYPPTTDPELLAQVLDNSARGFKLPAGSSLRAGLAAALEGLPAGEEADTARAVVVISDGEYPLDDVADLAPYRERGIRIFAIGVGTREGGQIPVYDSDGRPAGFVRSTAGSLAVSRLDEGPLRSVAEQTGGRYWTHGGADGVVAEVVRELQALDAAELVTGSGTVPDDRYQLALGLAVAVLLAAWLIDDRVAMPAPPSGRPAPQRVARRLRRLRWARIGTLALATILASCADAVAEGNQAANTLFARGDYRGALARYRELQAQRPDLAALSVNAGNALYRMQERPRALADYEIAAASEDANVRLNAHYGRGSALFLLGRLDEAREAFKDALRADPTDRDSKFNIEVIDRLAAADQTGSQPTPGQPGATGQPGSGQQGGPQSSPQPGSTSAPGPSAPPEPGDGGTQGQQGGTPPQTLDQALLEFRRDLTQEDALRLLDALMREQGGLEGLLEGEPRPGDAERPY